MTTDNGEEGGGGLLVRLMGHVVREFRYVYTKMLPLNSDNSSSGYNNDLSTFNTPNNGDGTSINVINVHVSALEYDSYAYRHWSSTLTCIDIG